MADLMTISDPRQTIGSNATQKQNDEALNSSPRGDGTIVSKLGSRFFALVLMASGIAALVYQVLWIKQLSLVVGAEVYSVTIAVSAFFAGLAMGGAYFGRLADRWARPLLLYSLLEAAVAFAGIASTLLLAHAAVPFALIEARAGVLAWVFPFLLVGLPAFFMGGTLPVAVRAYAPAGTRVAGVGGNLYAINTAGGVLGALLCTFVLIPWCGIRGTALAAAVCNLAAAGGALLLARFARERMASPEDRHTQSILRQNRFALMLYALAGGIALGYEVIWSQALVQFLSTRSFAFSIVLATYLTGLVLGSALYVRYASRTADAWGSFGLLISAAGLVALVEVAGLTVWQLRVQALIGDLAFLATGNETAGMYSRFLVAAMGMIFVPALLLGAAFPAALRLVARERWVGRDVGLMVALNTAGGVAGTLLTGFVLLPLLGLVRSLAGLAIWAAFLGALAALQRSNARGRLRWIIFTVGLATIVVSLCAPPDRLGRLLVSTRGGGKLVFYEESNGGTVSVLQQKSATNTFRRLYIQGVSNSGDAMPSLRYMRLQALLPLIIHHGEPRSALVIGFGTGITAGALLQYPQLQQRVCAELLPAVIRAAPAFPGNYRAEKDPGLRIVLADGRRELIRSSSRYDLITLEPPPPSARGVVNLYSSDFYTLAAKRLNRNGLLAQWLPLATQNDADTRSLVHSFLDVFPYATLWTTELHETLLIGSFDPIVLDAKRITERFNQPQVAATLGEVGIASPAALLATWVTGHEGLRRFALDAPSVTDDRPRIEYSAWVRPAEVTRTLPELLALGSTLPLAGPDPALSSGISQERENLMGFYAAGLAGYRGDRGTWARDIVPVLRRDPDNPYYRWFVGQSEAAN
jgi:spermidine synthase